MYQVCTCVPVQYVLSCRVYDTLLICEEDMIRVGNTKDSILCSWKV